MLNVHKVDHNKCMTKMNTLKQEILTQAIIQVLSIVFTLDDIEK